MSLLFCALVVAFVAVKVYRLKVSGIILGTCIGALAWSLISVAVTIIRSIATAFG